ncbi:Alpha/Beta hydrolase protein [Cantharellus anzutake]|uniref:Alpha/Beta hydrolase protein n=1 Tax=Cantharellus anzutake TaxID=1750568 RepID=UPI0019046808|nr:Alpha/Beta hydrolase protein [Cantharellus anzutake]KAF8324155.1 Alpha/Beta hydrolase protein [Cantharellus anzutake]
MAFKGPLRPQPFMIKTPEQVLDNMKMLIKLGHLSPTTYEGTHPEAGLGISDHWIKNAKEAWLSDFDWRAHENRINSFPNWRVNVTDDDGTIYHVHFIGAFSHEPNAVPLVLLHGWPGSIIEFLDIIPILQQSKYPSFHIIAPSLPGYGWTSGPPPHVDLNVSGMARIVDKLVTGIGFRDYVVQGGDIGSHVARIIGSRAQNCRVNMFVSKGEPATKPPLSPADEERLRKTQEFLKIGYGYGIEQGTRPSTIGQVLSSNPLASLAWIGEKVLAWTDSTPTMDTILAMVTLYWVTSSASTSLYPYRALAADDPPPYISIKKPLGYSIFPKEILSFPAGWLAYNTNLVFVREHQKGGHFAALECPNELAQDIIEFVSALPRLEKSPYPAL